MTGERYTLQQTTANAKAQAKYAHLIILMLMAVVKNDSQQSTSHSYIHIYLQVLNFNRERLVVMVPFGGICDSSSGHGTFHIRFLFQFYYV